MVAGDATHAGGDADAEGGVVAVVVKRALKRYELDAGGLGDGTGDAEFEVFLVVARKGEERLAVGSGTEDSAGIQAAAEGDGGFAKQRQRAFGDGLPEGRGELFGKLFSFPGRLRLRLEMKVAASLLRRVRVLRKGQRRRAGVGECLDRKSVV